MPSKVLFVAKKKRRPRPVRPSGHPFRARKAMPYFVQDQSFINFDNDAIKISVKDAKYTHYELGTVLLFNKF